MSTERELAETEVLIEESLEILPDSQSVPSTANGPPTLDQLSQLLRHLQSVRQQVEQVETWAESSLSHARVTPTSPDSGNTVLANRVDALLNRLDRIEQALNASQNKTQLPEGSPEITLPKLASIIQESHRRLSGRLKQVEEKLSAIASDGLAAREAINRTRPDSDDAAMLLEAVTANVPQSSAAGSTKAPLTAVDPAVLFGGDLIGDSRTTDGLVELTRRLADDDPKAIGLIGQLMTWRSAPRERIPKLLGDVGDSFYACFPRSSDQIPPLELALVETLAKKCIECDVPNTIELVRPGERFDPSRHRMRAGDRGAEVTEIHGWIVVGPDGQILNRAQVGVK
ncbi:MAG: hypothetical protein JSS49_23800 [Planctomycetes bacterium]|nr:hypothetical protein [Planctomycetota bacterium]